MCTDCLLIAILYKLSKCDLNIATKWYCYQSVYSWYREVDIGHMSGRLRILNAPLQRAAQCGRHVHGRCAFMTMIDVTTATTTSSSSRAAWRPSVNILTSSVSPASQRAIIPRSECPAQRGHTLATTHASHTLIMLRLHAVSVTS